MSDELVTVKSFVYSSAAEVAKLHLQEAGIQAFIADGEVGTMLTSNLVGYVKLQVSSSQAQAALSMLEQFEDVDHEATANVTRCLSCDTIMPEGVAVCPKCGWSYEVVGETDSAAE